VSHMNSKSSKDSQPPKWSAYQPGARLATTHGSMLNQKKIISPSPMHDLTSR